MKHALLVRFLLLIALTLVMSMVSFGQTAQVTGRVSDQAGAIVPGAQITVTNVGTGIKRESLYQWRRLFHSPVVAAG